MRHLHAAMLCGVFRVSVYDVKDVCWGNSFSLTFSPQYKYVYSKLVGGFFVIRKIPPMIIVNLVISLGEKI